MTRLYIFALLVLTCFGSALAQYQFENKKAEKLYEKLEQYYAEGDYEGILKSEGQITDLFLNKQDTLGALMHGFLGEAYLYWENDLNKSLGFYQKEYELRSALGTEGGDIKNLIFNLGYIQDELGFYGKTESLYLELLRLEEAASGVKSEDYFISATSLLDHYVFTEEFNKGLELIKDLKKNVDRKSFEEAMLLKFTGDFYQMSGSNRKSEKALLESLDILKENGLYASVEYVSVLNSMGGLYTIIGKIPVAEEVYQEALSIMDRLQGDYSDYQLALKGNLALILQLLGNYDEAEEIYLENLAADEEFYGTESFVYGMEAYNLASNYMYAQKYAKAEKYFMIAAGVFKADMGQENLYYARVLQNLTYLYTQTRQLDKAKENGLKAIELVEKAAGDNLYQVSFAYYNLGDAYFTDGDVTLAEKYHAQALELRKKGVGTGHSDYAKSTNKMAILNWNKNKLDAALGFYKETFKNYFDQINMIFPILSEDEKSKFYYNNLKPAFEQYNSFIVETSREEKELISEMYNYQLATKGLILYATNKVKDAIVNSNDPALISKYETWIEQKEQLAKLFSASEIPANIRNQKIDSLNASSNALEKELSKASSVFAQTVASRNLTWKDIQTKLKPGEAAVEVIRFRDFTPDSAGVFTDEVYYAALIITDQTKDYPEMVLMRNGKLMETKYLSNYRNAIKYKIDEDFSYKLFWRPIANKLEGIKKVYFSPDGVFNQISIYTLRNPATGNFTLDELEIQLVTNTKDLVALNADPNTDNKSYLFGYPNYNMGVLDSKKEEGGSTAKGIVDAASEGRGMSRGVRGSRGGDDTDIASLSRGGSLPRGIRGNMLRYMRSNQMLALLPGTKKEVNLIDSLYQLKNASVTTYLSNDALEDSIKNMKSPRTLHIATHGFFLESEEEEMEGQDKYVQNPLLRSGLILAGANSYISEGKISDEVYHHEDGILTAFEAMNLNLDQTELVVLSACETGLGEIKNGEGVYGLQRAFQVAGADAIIMSMWTVDDDATQELMTIFYEEWLGGKTKQDAFIIAQKRLKAKWKSPYYWGAFVMVGI
ncbi:MAG: CHAT domain-containing tetratricopeptide repeat protein [Marinoscillum sp.]|uniref:CHAT domain-containing protein n=1 Tax=Marinoscillum sp. TaxID=2024838 RepID=UPI0032F42AB1